MVGQAGDDIAVEVDGGQVDRRAEHLERAGLREGVLEPIVMKSRCTPAASRTLPWFQYRTSNAGGAFPMR